MYPPAHLQPQQRHAPLNAPQGPVDPTAPMFNGLTPKCVARLDGMFGAGFCPRSSFDQRIFDDMRSMSENQLLCCLDEFMGVSDENKVKIRSFGGYFVGIMRNYREGGRDHVIDPKTGQLTGNPVGPRRVLEQQQQQAHAQHHQRAAAAAKPPTWQDQMNRLNEAAPPVAVIGRSKAPAPSALPPSAPPAYQYPLHPSSAPQYGLNPALASGVGPLAPPAAAPALDISSIAARAASAVALLQSQSSLPLPAPAPAPPAPAAQPPTVPTIKSLPLIVQYALTNLENKTGLDPSTLPPPILTLVASMSAGQVTSALHRFAGMDLNASGNKSALLMATLNEARGGEG